MAYRLRQFCDPCTPTFFHFSFFSIAPSLPLSLPFRIRIVSHPLPYPPLPPTYPHHTRQATMKFSNTLEFNAVREWSDYYLAYERLKRIIYEIEMVRAKAWQKEGRPVEEIPALTDPIVHEKTQEFVEMLNAELNRINGFYRQKEKELADDVADLERMVYGEGYRGDLVEIITPGAATTTTTSMSPYTRHRATSTTPFASSAGTPSPASDTTIAAAAAATREQPNGFTTSSTPDIFDEKLPLLGSAIDYTQRLEFRTKAKETYVSLCSLKEYVVLNYTAFSKILKKFDKVLDGRLMASYMPTLESSYFWTQNVDSAHHAALNDLIDRVVRMYARLVCDGSVQRALSELGHYLREYVVWERNTIWRDMVGKERRVTAVGVKRVAEPPVAQLRVRIPAFGCTVALDTKVVVFGLVAVAVFLLLLFLGPFDNQRQNKCMALLVFASILWASEVITVLLTEWCSHVSSACTDVQCYLYIDPCTPPCWRRTDPPTVCHLHAHSIADHFPGRTGHPAAGRSIAGASQHQEEGRARVRRHVLPGDHAAARWIRHRRGPVQIPYSQAHGHVHLESRWHALQQHPAGHHLRGHLRQHVDLQCGRARALLFRDSGESDAWMDGWGYAPTNNMLIEIIAHSENA